MAYSQAYAQKTSSFSRDSYGWYGQNCCADVNNMCYLRRPARGKRDASTYCGEEPNICPHYAQPEDGTENIWATVDAIKWQLREI